MFDLDAMATFVAVVRSGNFTGGASALRLPRSTVSQRVARLETMLGVRLLERSTRAVRPTEAGTNYYERCIRILADVEDANVAVSQLGSLPRGHLRVATPHLFGQAVLAEVACGFSRRYPEVHLEIIASDGRVNIIEEGFDVAIVIAADVEDSSLISRTIGAVALWCCAAPSYLEKRGTPSTPDDLTSHDCVAIRRDANAEAHDRTWTLTRSGEVRSVDVAGRLTFNSPMMAHAAARSGAGLAALPSVICADDIRTGRLVRILPDWSVDRKDVHVVYASNRYLSSRVRLFVETLMNEGSEIICGHAPLA